MGDIIRFPGRPPRADGRDHLASHLRDSFAVPERDAELALLVQMADQLLDNLSDDGVDTFGDGLDRWRDDNMG